MYDLETLRRMEEAAYIRQLRTHAMINEGLDVAIKPDSVPYSESEPGREPGEKPVYPLADLAQKLLVGPPSLVRLIDMLADSDSVADFLDIVREFVPHYEADIMAAVSDDYRIERFCHYFSNAYFPLDDGRFFEEYALADFTHCLPVQLMGWSSDDYDEFTDNRAGFVLLLAMVESPYDSSMVDNQRVPILEKVKDLVGVNLMDKIPPAGWSLEDIHEKFDDSTYPGVIAFADWIHQNTGCWQLDANYSEYQEEMWSRRVVDGLTEQWPLVVELQDKMFKTYLWLEEDLHLNFSKLMAIMTGDPEVELNHVPKNQMKLPLDM